MGNWMNDVLIAREQRRNQPHPNSAPPDTDTTVPTEVLNSILAHANPTKPRVWTQDLDRALVETWLHGNNWKKASHATGRLAQTCKKRLKSLFGDDFAATIKHLDDITTQDTHTITHDA
eukprot:GHVO01050362.1.p1 GENE.GHVO01050362.1~~GHVO01050362.1.p1  ORF type:complete len:119 (+),score=16.18 GHVO01050362.1:250-606(+)